MTLAPPRSRPHNGRPCHESIRPRIASPLYSAERMPSDSFDIEAAASRLAEQGVAVVLLRERTKRPELNNWTTLPRMTVADLRRRYKDGQNIGIRLGEPSETRPRRYVYAVDLDIRDPDSRRASREAWAALEARFPGCRAWPRSISGSGGDSRHLLITSDGRFRKTNIARSDRRVDYRGEEKPAWEIDFYGTGSQVVVAPSIHPNGRRYEWENGEPDFKNLPFVRATKIEPLFERKNPSRRERADYAPEPIDRLEEILSTRALDNDGGGLHYDDWRDVLFAIKQEYDGTDLFDEAFETVQEWSQKSDKHDQRRFEEVWDHARTDRPDAIGLGTLKKRAAPELQERRLECIVAEMEDERPPHRPGEPETPPDGLNPEWAREVITDGNSPINCPENRRLFLLHWAPVNKHLVWAEEEQRPVWRRGEEEPPPSMRDVVFEEQDSIPYDTKAHYQVLQMMLRKPPFRIETVRKEELNDSVFLVTRQRKWRRIKELLTRETWDGVPRVETLLQDYLGVKDSAYSRGTSRLLVVGPMCRVLWPGVKVDYAPILQGEQGTGKDRFLELLCTFGDECLYTATSFDLSKPGDYVQAIRGKLIVHLAEMAAFKKQSIEQIKTFITEHSDTARLSYEPMAQLYRRTCIFVFSTNKRSGYLSDSTGNRRFLPNEVGDPKMGSGGIPTAYRKTFLDLENERGQIWAEAYAMAVAQAESEGGRVRAVILNDEALAIARQVQEDKKAESIEEDMAARGARLLDEAVPLDDLLEEKLRNDGTARRMAIRNTVAPREFWCDVLGEKKDLWQRNTHITAQALDLLNGWDRVPGRHRHLGEVRTIYRRNGSDGKPTIVDDTRPEQENIVGMEDERLLRRTPR